MDDKEIKERIEKIRVKRIVEKYAPKIPSERKERQEKLDGEKEECYYQCDVPLGNKYFVVIKEGRVVRAHEKCQKKFERGEEMNIRVVVK